MFFLLLNMGILNKKDSNSLYMETKTVTYEL